MIHNHDVLKKFRQVLFPGLFLFLNSSIGLELPYTQRTRSYLGFSTAIRGDLRTVGMSGATLGLADNLVGTIDNPAGLAMTLGGTTAQITTTSVSDGYVQDFSQSISTTSFGIASSLYRWGLSFSIWNPYAEGQSYTLNGETLKPTLDLVEYRFGVAYVLPNHRWSFGVNVGVGVVDRTLQRLSGTSSTTSTAVVGSIGIQHQLPRRWILGLSYHFPSNYKDALATDPTQGVTQFHQAVHRPSRLGVGVGWIPSRTFQFGVTLYAIAPVSGAAPLRNTSISTGASLTLQPRLGVSYMYADYKEYEGGVMLGSYLEPSTIDSTADRVHLTTGITAEPWIFDFGIAYDTAKQYENFIVTAGIDFIKVLSKLDLIPTPYRPQSAGFLPAPDAFTDEGLPRPLVKEWKDRGPPVNIIEVGKQLPAKIEEKLSGVPSWKTKPPVKKGNWKKKSSPPKKKKKKKSTSTYKDS